MLVALRILVASSASDLSMGTVSPWKSTIFASDWKISHLARSTWREELRDIVLKVF